MHRILFASAIIFTVLLICVPRTFAASGTAVKAPSTEAGGGQPMTTITVTGKVLQGPDGYIIRGTQPAEIFRVMNPASKSLNAIVAAGKAVRIQVRSVVGDNVEIIAIDGSPLPSPD